MYNVQMLRALSVAHLLANRVDMTTGHGLLHDMLLQCSIYVLTFTSWQDISSHPCYLGHGVSVAMHVISVSRLLLHCLAHLPAAVPLEAAVYCVTSTTYHKRKTCQQWIVAVVPESAVLQQKDLSAIEWCISK